MEKRFPVIFREMKESGKEYFDAANIHRFPGVARFARPHLSLAAFGMSFLHAWTGQNRVRAEC